MKFSSEELIARRPVWESLSDLFLDTDVSLFRKSRISKLAVSTYSVAEIEMILVEEVFPICVSNLFNVAGEWVGFDLTWVENKIIEHVGSPYHRLRMNYFARLMMFFSPEWRATKAGIFAARRRMR